MIRDLKLKDQELRHQRDILHNHELAAVANKNAVEECNSQLHHAYRAMEIHNEALDKSEINIRSVTSKLDALEVQSPTGSPIVKNVASQVNDHVIKTKLFVPPKRDFQFIDVKK